MSDEVDGGLERRDGETPAASSSLPLTPEVVSSPEDSTVVARAVAYVESLRADREHRAWVDVLLRVYERHRAMGGSLLAGALGYRLFLVSLPLALLSAGALGFALAADATSAGEAADAAGLPGLMTDALSSSAAGIEGSRWWTGIGGLVLLLWASLTLLRALRTVDALAWQQPIPRLRHAARATLVFVTVLISVAAFTGAADLDSLSWVPWKVFANLGLLVSYGSLWLILSAWLPHREARLGDLVPGAALFAAGTKAFHLLVVVWVAPRFESGSALYGMFGMITALLLALYVFGAIVVLSAVLNAVLWERRHERSGAGAPDPAA